MLSLSLYVPIALIILYLLAQLIDLRAEYYSPFSEPSSHGTDTWAVHHDEKLIVPDARFFRLKKEGRNSLEDYKPYPASAAFGVAGPLLSAMGLRLFGLNNFGLRFFYVLIAALTNLSFFAILHHSAPMAVNAVFFVIYLINYRSFVVSRHAIIENILPLCLLSPLLVYLALPQFFIGNINYIAFAASAVVLVKPNFLGYVYSLIFSLYFFHTPDMAGVIHIALGGLSGLVFFEGIHWIILKKMGIAEFRYYNLRQAIKAHSGKATDILQRFQPEGLLIFKKFFFILLEWFEIPIKFRRSLRLSITISVLLLLICFIGFGFYGIPSEQKNVVISIAIFLFLYLIISAPLLFYTKRAYPLVPFIIIMVAILTKGTVNSFAKLYPGSPSFTYPLLVCFGLLCLYLQLKILTGGQILRMIEGDRNSKALENELPADSVVYAHCYAYRFFWQVSNLRMMSADDQIMNNQMIVDWAIEKKARYILLSGRGGKIKKVPSDFPVAANIRYLQNYSTSRIQSDEPDDYVLFEIIWHKPHDHPAKNQTPDNSDSNFAAICNQLNYMADAWRYFNMVGLTLKILDLDLRSLKELKTRNQELPSGVAKEVSEVYNFFNTEGLYEPDLGYLGEDLLFTLMQRESLFSKGVELLEQNGFKLKHPEWYCLIGDHYGGNDAEYGFKWYLKFLSQAYAHQEKNFLDPSEAQVMSTLYRRASGLKSTGNTALAKEIFSLVAQQGYQKWGAYFHQGEIELKLGNYSNAQLLFKKCLVDNPLHKKARRYLKEIEEKL